MSSTQTLATFTLFDYEMNDDNTARSYEYVYVWQSATVVNGSPVVNLAPKRFPALTDTNGYWSQALVRSQGTTEYVVQPPGRPAYRVTVPSAGAGPFQASANKASDSA